MSGEHFPLIHMFLAYIIGSIPFSQIIAWWRTGTDLRVEGYRNVGAYNVVHMAGISWGLIAGLLDAVKGMVVLVVAARMGVMNPLDKLMGLCAVVGHNYPVWLGFRGGKGVMVAVGLFFGIAPLETVLAVMAGFLVFGMAGYVNLSVIGGFAMLVIATFVSGRFNDMHFLMFGTLVLIGLAYMPRFLRWLSRQRS